MSDSPDIPRLEAAFRGLAARMVGAPGFNPALFVVAAGFRPWQGQWLGAVVTPWAIQLVLLPGEKGVPLAGEHREYPFPAGERTLLGLELEGFGPVATAPLLASVENMAGQAVAEQAALAAFSALMAPAGLVPEMAPRAGGEPEEPQPRKPVSRRDFLRGRLFGR